jgi:adenylate cyclase
VVTVALDITDFKATERARGNLARYFAPNMVERLATEDEPLGPARSQNVAVMFVDIFDFTRLCMTDPPERVFALLREFLARIANQVFVHGGTLDKYMGDGTMATFGTPESGPRDATNALSCARDIGRMIDAWNRERRAAGQSAIEIGIGVHHGPALLGNIGSEQRLEFAVVGDTVNVASRLEKLTREIRDAGIVASDAVIAAARREGGAESVAGFEAIGAREIRGRDETVSVWIRRRESAR